MNPAVIAAIPSFGALCVALIGAYFASQARHETTKTQQSVNELHISVNSKMDKLMEELEKRVRAEEEAKAAQAAALLAAQVAKDTQSALDLQAARDAPPIHPVEPPTFNALHVPEQTIIIGEPQGDATHEKGD